MRDMDICDYCMVVNGSKGSCGTCLAGKRQRKEHMENQREESGGNHE